MLALALVLDGRPRTEAAQMCGMDRQTLRDWVHRYNNEGLAGLSDRKAPGPAPRLSTQQQAEVAALVRAGPDLEDHGIVRWRRSDLSQVIKARYGVHLSERSVGALLARLGFAHISVRPHNPAQDPVAIEAHKKRMARPVRKRLVVMQSDQSTPTYPVSGTSPWPRWRSARPGPHKLHGVERHFLCQVSRTPIDCQAISLPTTGAALVLPYADKHAMTLHLAEISRAVAPGAHAVVIVDGAEWHKPGGRLRQPDNISMLVLPPYSPELNPQENIWQFLRQDYLSNRVFATYSAIVDSCCAAWNALVGQSGTITSIASREWAQTVTV